MPKLKAHKAGIVTYVRLRIVISGAIQGVGFRPFVFTLANELKLKGIVQNIGAGVMIEAEGELKLLEKFEALLDEKKPPNSFFTLFKTTWLEPVGYKKFQIISSASETAIAPCVLPDIGICPECSQEIMDPDNRRYRYPFTNCTRCGPRFSIVQSLPYDRVNTTMDSFEMCAQCRQEYDNPSDRRFHAQPIACHQCGPSLQFINPVGNILCSCNNAFSSAVAAIRNGSIIAVKGLCGFHLIVDAENKGAVQRLRYLKARDEKPFAVMAPSLAWIEQHCEVDHHERRLLQSLEAQIVLLSKKPNVTNALCKEIAPGNPWLGVMLPCTPLHFMMMADLKKPVIATSGNLKDEPICIDNDEALERLGNVADFFLLHNRPILRHADDSIVRMIAGREMILRRARGYAPLPIPSSKSLPEALAVGAHLKNTIAVSKSKNIYISQHIGDLDTPLACESFKTTISDFIRFYKVSPTAIVRDSHPDYQSSQYADKQPQKKVAVQHHLAHVLSCMIDNDLEPPFLGVSWDGTGLGTDGVNWGGEFFNVTKKTWQRFAHFRSFPMPGGEAAIREPRRVALGLLYETLGKEAFDQSQLDLFRTFKIADISTLASMLEKNIQSMRTTSAGRLFDAVSSILGIKHFNSYEGQAAMALEFQTDNYDSDEQYFINLCKTEKSWVLDWEHLVRSILHDLHCHVPIGCIAVRFHNALADAIVQTRPLGKTGARTDERRMFSK